MTDPTEPNQQPTDSPPDIAPSSHQYEEGKRAGAHPVLVVFGIILGLWLLLWLYIPSSKNKEANSGLPPPSSSFENADEAPIMFHVKATLAELKVITLVVPTQATESQIAGLLYRFRNSRLDNSLKELLPPTTPGHKLGDHAIADIFVFSDPSFAQPNAVEVLARGAHAPGNLYPQAIPFEVAMEQVRGHYRIDLNDPGHPDQASLGFADASGVHSKHFQPLF